MDKHGTVPFDANRRTFLKLSAATVASFAVVSKSSAKAAKAIEPVPDYGGLVSKTEEYQEAFLLGLPDAEKDFLISKIRSLRPEAARLLSQGEIGHVLRTWYVSLKLAGTGFARNPSVGNAASASDVLVPTSSPLRTPAPGNAAYRISFFRNMPAKIEPFDLFASENRAVVINGNYGVFDGGRCREHTWDGRPLETFLPLSHGDFIETSATEAYGENGQEFLGSGIRMPKAVIDANSGIPLCSQVARKLGESFWLPFARGNSAISSLGQYGSRYPKYSDFSQIPESKTVADVFMKSLAHPLFWHRAFAFKTGTQWFVVDPFSHRQPISAAQYRRRKDVFAIVAFG